MRISKTVGLSLLLACFGMLLNACSSAPQKPIPRQVVNDDGGHVLSSNSLSAQRIADIRSAFIGRSFIFKEDWFEYALIDSDPVGGFGEPTPITQIADWAKKRGYQQRASSTGTVGEIVGMRMYRDGMVFICKLETSGMAYIKILNYRAWTLLGRHRGTAQRRALKDNLITVPWVERNLTFHTAQFIADLPEIPELDLVLPKPPRQPTLTAVKNTASEPFVSQLSIQVSPAQVRQQQQLQLVLNYSVDSSGQGSATVIETRTLLFNNSILPNYPKTTTISRNSARHSSTFKLTVPARAKAGNYLFQGKVCIAGNCVSSSKPFQVLP